MYSHVHVCMYVFIHVCMSEKYVGESNTVAYAYVCMYVWGTRTGMYIHMHTYIRPYITYLYTYIHTYIHTQVPWLYLGRYRSHHAPIVGLTFIHDEDGGIIRLVSLGHDRVSMCVCVCMCVCHMYVCMPL
jgi:hypothetical protein